MGEVVYMKPKHEVRNYKGVNISLSRGASNRLDDLEALVDRLDKIVHLEEIESISMDADNTCYQMYFSSENKGRVDDLVTDCVGMVLEWNGLIAYYSEGDCRIDYEPHWRGP